MLLAVPPRRLLYGLNDMEIRVQSVLALVLLELLNPFYVFQIFSLAVWFSEKYYYYTIAIVVMSTFGITFTVRQTRRVSADPLWAFPPPGRGRIVALD